MLAKHMAKWLSMPTNTGLSQSDLLKQLSRFRGHSLMAPRGKAAIVPTAIKRNYLENSPHSATQQAVKADPALSTPSCEGRMDSSTESQFQTCCRTDPEKNTSCCLLAPDHEPITCMISYFSTHLSGRPRASI